MTKTLPEKTVERLSLLRRLLLASDKTHIFSHDIGKMMNQTSVQIRRDLMLMGYSGIAGKGYEVKSLIKAIGNCIDPEDTQYAAIIGMGNLGNAIAKYLHKKREHLKIIASFDNDERKINNCVSGIKCYHISNLKNVVNDLGISIGIITVPENAAVEIKDLLIEAGIKGILNLTPIPLQTPHNVYLTEYDMITSLEKTAYFIKNLQ